MELNSICEFIVDTKHKTPKFVNGGYPCIRTPNIGRGYFILENAKYVSEETYKEWTSRAEPAENDLILAREAPVGNVAIIPTGLKVCHGQRTVLIRPNPSKISPSYLMYLMLGDEIQHKMKSTASGATVAHLNMSDIRALKLPKLPSMKTQQKIASILSTYDDLIENNHHRIAILEEMARRLYREWFVKFRFSGHEEVKMVESELGEIPEGWEVVKLRYLLELVYGKALKKSERSGGCVAVYGSGGHIGFHNHSLVTGPCIVVGRKGNVGKVFWCHSDCWPIDTVFYVRGNLSKYYLYFNLKGQTFFNSDAAVPGLNREQAYNNKAILPSSIFLEQFDRFVEPLFLNIENLLKKNSNLKQQRDLLLPKLISGKIDVG